MLSELVTLMAIVTPFKWFLHIVSNEMLIILRFLGLAKLQHLFGTTKQFSDFFPFPLFPIFFLEREKTLPFFLVVSGKMLNFACRTGNCQFYQAKIRIKFARARGIFSTPASYQRVPDSLPESYRLPPTFSGTFSQRLGMYQNDSRRVSTFCQHAEYFMPARKIPFGKAQNRRATPPTYGCLPM